MVKLKRILSLPGTKLDENLRIPRLSGMHGSNYTPLKNTEAVHITGSRAYCGSELEWKYQSYTEAHLQTLT